MKKSGSKRDFDFEPSFNDAEDDQSTVPDKKRRLRTDQVKALERCFEVDNKLEPERKVQLAIEFGLDPRQVSIWFQNRRARWKTKQLERDYVSLQSDFDALKRSYESVKQENGTLVKQIGEMKARIGSEDVVFKEEMEGGGVCGFSLDYEGAFYGDVNVVSMESAMSGVHSEENVVSSYENVGNEGEDNFEIWPLADTYSFLVDEEAVPVFNWCCPDPWT